MSPLSRRLASSAQVGFVFDRCEPTRASLLELTARRMAFVGRLEDTLAGRLPKALILLASA